MLALTGSKHPCYRGVLVTATAQFQSTKYGLRFCAGTNPACGARGLR